MAKLMLSGPPALAAKAACHHHSEENCGTVEHQVMDWLFCSLAGFQLGMRWMLTEQMLMDRYLLLHGAHATTQTANQSCPSISQAGD